MFQKTYLKYNKYRVGFSQKNHQRNSGQFNLLIHCKRVSTSGGEGASFWLASEQMHRNGLPLNIMGELSTFNAKNFEFSANSDIKERHYQVQLK